MPKKPTLPKKDLPKKDLNAFYKAIEGTKPLIKEKIRLAAPSTHRKAARYPQFEKKPLQFSEAQDLQPVRGEEFIAYKQNDVSNKTLRKLRKGQYNVDAVLDLHGMSVEEAILAVESFLQQCLHEGIRVVLIIHGKGHHKMPVLKNKLNHWLRELNVVLAFCSAAPIHGSRGALYVLLKRTAEENMLE